MKVEKREIRVQNVVASAAFNHGIDLDAIVEAFPHVEYQPKVFPGLAFRLKIPKTCILIFNSGRMVCTGAKSEREAGKARALVEWLDFLRRNSKDPDPRVWAITRQRAWQICRKLGIMNHTQRHWCVTHCRRYGSFHSKRSLTPGDYALRIRAQSGESQVGT